VRRPRSGDAAEILSLGYRLSIYQPLHTTPAPDNSHARHRAELRFACHVGMGWAATPLSRTRGQLEKDKGASPNGVLTARSRPVSREGGGTTRTCAHVGTMPDAPADVRRIMHKELSDTASLWGDIAAWAFDHAWTIPLPRVGFHCDGRQRSGTHGWASNTHGKCTKPRPEYPPALHRAEVARQLP
jgi:hypothetical protein